MTLYIIVLLTYKNIAHNTWAKRNYVPVEVKEVNKFCPCGSVYNLQSDERGAEAAAVPQRHPGTTDFTCHLHDTIFPTVFPSSLPKVYESCYYIQLHFKENCAFT